MSGLLMDQKRQTYLLTGILGVALLLRVLLVLLHGHTMLLGSLTAYDNDDVRYIRSAAILLDEYRLVYRYTDQSTPYIGPVSPAAMALVFSVFGAEATGIRAFQVCQALIGTLSVLLIFLVGRRLFGPPVGLLAAAVYAVEPTAIWNCGLLLTETLITCLLLLVVYVALRALETKSVRQYLLLGALIAVAAMLKSVMGLFLGVVFIGMLAHRYAFRDIAKYLAIAALAFAVVMSPWWVRNYLVFHRFIPFTASSGNPMILGTFVNLEYDPTDLRGYYGDPTELGQDAIEVQVAKERMGRKFRKEFWTYAYWYTIGKTFLLWRDPFFWVKGEVMRLVVPVFAAHYVTLLLGGIGAVLAFLHRRRRQVVLPLTILAYITVLHLPFFVMSRYSFPAMTLVIILASYTVVSLWTSHVRHHPRLMRWVGRLRRTAPV